MLHANLVTSFVILDFTLWLMYCIMYAAFSMIIMPYSRQYTWYIHFYWPLCFWVLKLVHWPWPGHKLMQIRWECHNSRGKPFTKVFMKERSRGHRSLHGYIVLSYIELHSQRQTWTFYTHVTSRTLLQTLSWICSQLAGEGNKHMHGSKCIGLLIEKDYRIYNCI